LSRRWPSSCGPNVVERLGPPLDEPIFDELAIIGVGLIGSSVARAARKRKAVRRIVLADRSRETLARAKDLALGDEITNDLKVAVRNADCVLLCAPIGATEEIGRTIAPALKAGAIVSDVGSVKGAVLSALEPVLPSHARLVPAHPVAGTEQSGPDAGFASLFMNRWCILTPPEGADPGAVKSVRAFWEALGSHVETMGAAHHDLVLAITSHVPHLIAYNIVGTAAELEEVTRSEVIKFSAGGFRDFTRIAASDPTMWRDVFLYNKDAVLEMLGRFNEDLTALQRMIRRGDGDGLFELFTRTRAIRLGIVAEGQETAAPDFGRLGPQTDEQAP
jgi:cyclohexadieny/prephenate dehydrogenase